MTAGPVRYCYNQGQASRLARLVSRHLCMMTSNGAKTRRITCDWVAWGTPPMFWIFCAFFVVIFYVISYHSTNAAGPRSSEGQPSCLPAVRFYMRLKTRPHPGHSHRITDHVRSYSILLWPQDVAKILLFLQVAFAHLIKY